MSGSVKPARRGTHSQGRIVPGYSLGCEWQSRVRTSTPSGYEDRAIAERPFYLFKLLLSAPERLVMHGDEILYSLSSMCPLA